VTLNQRASDARQLEISPVGLERSLPLKRSFEQIHPAPFPAPETSLETRLPLGAGQHSGEISERFNGL
jgi:hypothetical protein